MVECWALDCKFAGSDLTRGAVLCPSVLCPSSSLLSTGSTQENVQTEKDVDWNVKPQPKTNKQKASSKDLSD